MKLKIKVTNDVLRRSMWCKSYITVYQNCAIALAVRDIFPNAYTHSEYINPFEETMNRQRIWLPKEAKLFIMDFDFLRYNPERRMLLPEIEFEVELPQEVIDVINIDDIHRSETLELISD